MPSIFSWILKTLSRKTYCDLASLIPVSRSFSLQLLWKWRIHLKWIAFGSSVFQPRNGSSSPSVMKPFAAVNPLQLLTQVDANTLYVSKFFLWCSIVRPRKTRFWPYLFVLRNNCSYTTGVASYWPMLKVGSMLMGWLRLSECNVIFTSSA